MIELLLADAMSWPEATVLCVGSICLLGFFYFLFTSL